MRILEINKQINEMKLPKVNIGDCFMLVDGGEISCIQVIELSFKALIVDNEPSINIVNLDVSDFYRYEHISKRAFLQFYNKISKRLFSKIK